MQKLIASFLLIMLLVSCQLFLSPENSVKNNVDAIRSTIDWDYVDGFPHFEDCDEVVSKEKQWICFEETMLLYCYSAFSEVKLESEETLNDTVMVDFKVDYHGFVRVSKVHENERVNELFPDFNSEIKNRLNDVTGVSPAIKRGVPVSMMVRLPIVLKTR